MHQRKRKGAHKRHETEEYITAECSETSQVKSTKPHHSENLKSITVPQQWSVTDSKDPRDLLEEVMGCQGER